MSIKAWNDQQEVELTRLYLEEEIKVLGTKRIICYSFKDRVDCMLQYDEKV